MTAPRVGLIWAQADDAVIGRDGAMPWHVPEDLAHFAQITRGAPVVMGRTTWDSLNPTYRPLPGRRNIVVTRQDSWVADGAERAASVPEALQIAAAGAPEWVWVIGGGEIYRSVIAGADRLEVTELRVPGFAPSPDDVRAPGIDSSVFPLVDSDPDAGQHTSRTGIRYRFLRYERLASA